jgi:hypothetical protein
MAHRREDVNMLEYIRQLESRIKRLETKDKGVRQNDIRIGNQLISEGTVDNTLTVRDLRNNAQFVLPSPSEPYQTEVTFSWAGAVTDVIALNNVSPPYKLNRAVTVHEIVLAAITTGGAPPEMRVGFLDASGGLITTHDINTAVTGTGPYSTKQTVSVSVPADGYIYATLDDEGDGDWANMTVTARWS